MKIIEVREFGGPDKMQLVERPTPTPKAGEILIEVRASGINFADLMAVAGQYPGVPSAPFDPGFEAAGVVSEVGDGVQGFQVGDRVAAFVGGGYATHAVARESSAFKLPENLDFADATALLVQGMTAYFLLEKASISEGKSVLVSSAAGGVGSLALQIAKLRGAGKVIGLASPGKHDIVRALGAEPVDYRQPKWSEQVKSLTDGRGVDIFLDSLGELSGEGFESLAEKAQWMIFGFQAGSSGALDIGKLIFRSISLHGFVLGEVAGADMQRSWSDMVSWFAAGQLEIKAEHRFALAEASRAHEAIAARQTSGKVVLEA